MSASETRSGRRKPRQSGDQLVLVVLDKCSKDALADLVIDLLRRCDGDELLDGNALARAFCEAFKPIAQIRGDRVPNVDVLDQKLAEVRRRRGAALRRSFEEDDVREGDIYADENGHDEYGRPL